MEIYSPPFRYLVSAQAEYPHAQGIARVNGHITVSQLDHLTAVESQIMLNQLGYAALGYWLHEGRLKKQIPFNTFLEGMSEKVVIRQLNTAFRRRINPHKDITMTLRVLDSREILGVYVIFTQYSVNNRNFQGEMNLALLF